ncbi:hypothetical protein LZ31DRAFT_215673 [Colletotrichum somersetense]|nr:hypothetical protein LZ31DRAFT_215673 [Colletotrichum somersetense]
MLDLNSIEVTLLVEMRLEAMVNSKLISLLTNQCSSVLCDLTLALDAGKYRGFVVLTMKRHAMVGHQGAEISQCIQRSIGWGRSFERGTCFKVFWLSFFSGHHAGCRTHPQVDLIRATERIHHAWLASPRNYDTAFWLVTRQSADDQPEISFPPSPAPYDR